MSYSGFWVIFFVNLGFLALADDLPKWVYVLSIIVACVFGAFAVNRFEEMSERVCKLEKELQKRKDGADNE